MNTYERLVLRLLYALLEIGCLLAFKIGLNLGTTYRSLQTETLEFLAKTPKM